MFWRLWFGLVFGSCIESQKDSGPKEDTDTSQRDSSQDSSSLPVDSALDTSEPVEPVIETECYAQLSLQFEPVFEGFCTFQGQSGTQSCVSIEDCPGGLSEGWSCDGNLIQHEPYTIDGCAFSDDENTIFK